MSTNPTNETLVARACQGDKAAFGDLYERLLDDIYRYVYYRVSSQEDAEDLAETVFLKAWQGLPNYKPEGAPFTAWLYRIAHNTVVDHYRTHKTAEPLADHPYLPDKRESVEAQVFSQTEIEQLKARLQEMTPIHQEVLVLRFINELSPAETAAALDKSNGAVRVLQHRALKELHALMTVGDIIDE